MKSPVVACRSRTVVWIVVTALVATAGAILGFFILLRGEQSIDAFSGRIRTQYRIGQVVFTESINETPFSHYLVSQGYVATDTRWHPVLEQTLLRSVSPNFRYHSVPAQLDQFMLSVREREYSSEAAHEITLHIIQLLKTDRPWEISEVLSSREGVRRKEKLSGLK